jgi:putative salt-induced outer membrane protein YdiY
MSINPTAPRKNLLAAVAVSAVLAAISCLSTASAQTQSGTTAQSPKSEMARCSQLYSARSHYQANGGDSSAQDTEAELALEQCKAGHFDNGIASLEGLLRQKGIPVPPAETASSP